MFDLQLSSPSTSFLANNSVSYNFTLHSNFNDWPLTVNSQSFPSFESHSEIQYTYQLLSNIKYNEPQFEIKERLKSEALTNQTYLQLIKEKFTLYSKKSAFAALRTLSYLNPFKKIIVEPINEVSDEDSKQLKYSTESILSSLEMLTLLSYNKDQFKILGQSLLNITLSDISSEELQTLVDNAILIKNYTFINYLITNFKIKNLVLPDNATILTRAIYFDDSQLVSFLIDKGYDVNGVAPFPGNVKAYANTVWASKELIHLLDSKGAVLKTFPKKFSEHSLNRAMTSEEQLCQALNLEQHAHWPNQTIYFYFTPDCPEYYKTYFENALNSYKKFIDINYKFVDSLSFANVKVTTTYNFYKLGQSSFPDDYRTVPTQKLIEIRPKPYLNGLLKYYIENRIPDETHFKFVIMHELGHFFGLIHPHDINAQNYIENERELANYASQELDTLEKTIMTYNFYSDTTSIHDIHYQSWEYKTTFDHATNTVLVEKRTSPYVLLSSIGYCDAVALIQQYGPSRDRKGQIVEINLSHHYGAQVFSNQGGHLVMNAYQLSTSANITMNSGFRPTLAPNNLIYLAPDSDINTLSTSLYGDSIFINIQQPKHFSINLNGGQPAHIQIHDNNQARGLIKNFRKNIDSIERVSDFKATAKNSASPIIIYHCNSKTKAQDVICDVEMMSKRKVKKIKN